MIGRWLSLAGALVVLSTATGCIEEKVELQVEQDGRGKVQFERVMGAQMSSMILGMAPNKDEALSASTAQALAEFQGIDAWTDVESFVRDGKIGFRGTGWYSDPAQLRRVSDKNETRFVIDRADGRMTLRIERETVESASGEPDRQDEMFTAPDAQFEQQRTMVKGMIGPMLGELKIEMAATLPGDVSDVTGFTKDGRRASWVVEGKTMSTMIDRVFERVGELRPKVKSGELTVAQAKETLEREFADFAGTSDFSAACPLPAEDKAAKAAFDEALAKAREAWSTSTWRTKLEEARAKAEQGDDGEMAPPPAPRRQGRREGGGEVR